MKVSIYRTPFTVEEVLADKSIVFPFTRAMCAPVSDGTSALVLCSEKALKRLGESRAVLIHSLAGTSLTFNNAARMEEAVSGLGREGTATRGQYNAPTGTNQSQGDHGEIIGKRMSEWCKQRSNAEVLTELSQARIPCGEMLSPDQVLRDE